MFARRRCVHLCAPSFSVKHVGCQRCLPTEHQPTRPTTPTPHPPRSLPPIHAGQSVARIQHVSGVGESTGWTVVPHSAAQRRLCLLARRQEQACVPPMPCKLQDVAVASFAPASWQTKALASDVRAHSPGIPASTHHVPAPTSCLYCLVPSVLQSSTTSRRLAPWCRMLPL